MSPRIPMRYTVSLQGFSDFERSALASFFRLAAQRDPAYDQGGSLDACDFLIANADHPATVAEMHEADRTADTVFVGARAPAGSGAWLQRPIEPTRIVRALDALIERRRLQPPSEPTTPDTTRPALDVLVVDDSRIALKFLQLRLQRLGFRVHLARDAHEALDKLRTQRFELVFLDIVLGPEGSIDGLSLCQYIKQNPLPDGHVPAVVLVTGRSSQSDRVRGSLAGCNGYLVKPLMDADLTGALRSLQLVDG